MQFRRYISTFIIILTLLGVVNQQQKATPNQEIVLQFVDVDAASDYAQETIAKVTGQLQDLGVENIKITELGNNLKIAYYSDADVSSIKDLLANTHNLDIDYSLRNEKGNSPFSSDGNHVTYNLDVYELQEINSNDWSFEGHVLEVKTETYRFSNPNVFTYINVVVDYENYDFYEVALKTNYTIAIAINNASYIIPEVRAGPIC